MTAAIKLKDTCSLEKRYDKTRQCIKKQRYHFANKGPYNQSYGFSSSHVTDVRVGPERRLSDEELMLSNCGAGEVPESPLDQKKIKPVNPNRNQEWIFIGRTDAEVEALILGHLMQRDDLLEKTLMLGKIQSRRKRWQRIRWLDGITDSVDSMIRFEQTLEDSEGQGSLVAAVHGVTKSQTQLTDWITTAKPA